MARRINHQDFKDSRFGGPVLPLIVVSTIDAGGNPITLTPDDLLGSLLLLDPNGNINVTTPSAAELLNNERLAGVTPGHGFEFTIRNTAGAAEAITLVGGVGITISGTATVTQNNTKRFLVVFTNVDIGTEAATIYSLGTAVH